MIDTRKCHKANVNVSSLRNFELCDSMKRMTKLSEHVKNNEKNLKSGSGLKQLQQGWLLGLPGLPGLPGPICDCCRLIRQLGPRRSSCRCASTSSPSLETLDSPILTRYGGARECYSTPAHVQSGVTSNLAKTCIGFHGRVASAMLKPF